MHEFNRDDEKNESLEKTRGVSFEDVVFHIQNDDILELIRHPNESQYSNQRIIVLNMEGLYLVPYVKQKGTRFLKTIIPSRKETKECLK